MNVGERYVWAGGRRLDVVCIELFLPREAPSHVVTRHEWGGDRPLYDVTTVEDFEEMIRDGDLVLEEREQ